MTNRRNFIKTATLSSLAVSSLTLPSLLQAKTKPLTILILGGTGFLGPHTVNAARARGHTITLFNRGKTAPDLFPDLETITGDRLTDDINKLANRQWDLVIDTSAYFPRAVDAAMAVLKKNIGQYLLVSTISVYADWSKPAMDETAPVATIEDPTVEKITGATYGPLKALSEQAALKALPNNSCIIRPGLIVGPRDKTDRFTYWPVRIDRGGDIIAPGDGRDFVQFIDVRDLAEWMIHCGEKQINGIFNAQTNGADITMAKLLETCQRVLNPQAKLHWLPKAFLAEHEVRPWQDMPVWLPPEGTYAGAGLMSSAKAYANGLNERPLADTIKACFDWFAQQPLERRQALRAGLDQEKEAKVLKAWFAQQKVS